MITTYDKLASVFNDPWLIGFSREFDRLNSITNSNSKVSYPPYNVVKIDEDNYRLDLAVAGFSKDDLEITVKDGALIIAGDIITADEDTEIVYRGIATRKFTRSFALGEYMEVDKAKMDNGILSIPITRVVPEEKKPKAITIK